MLKKTLYKNFIINFSHACPCKRLKLFHTHKFEKKKHAENKNSNKKIEKGFLNIFSKYLQNACICDQNFGFCWKNSKILFYFIFYIKYSPSSQHDLPFQKFSSKSFTKWRTWYGKIGFYWRILKMIFFF